MPRTVVFTAAHGGFAGQVAPLGGGAAVFEHLLSEWSRTRPFSVHAVTPAILGPAAPSARDLVSLAESGYAAFSRAFERAATARILDFPPQSTSVLVNDVSEGPDFAALARRGYRLFTIFHVDVVAYVSAIYLRGWVRPETTVRWYERLGRWFPAITGLVWRKQRDSVRHSQGLIVPSSAMRAVLLRCYPECPPGKIHVLPWGSWSGSQERDAPAASRLRDEFGIPPQAQILLTLSRISPEKGQDLLLAALLDDERRHGPPPQPRVLFICGEAAFMRGASFLAALRRDAARLRHTRVIFPGHVTGARKQAFFAAASLYIFPSRHESYGLTLLEALAAGVPALCLEHAGAREIVRPEFGELVRAAELAGSLRRLLADPARLASMGAAGRQYAVAHPFSATAAALAELLH